MKIINPNHQMYVNMSDNLTMEDSEIECVKGMLKDLMVYPTFDREFRRIVKKMQDLKMFDNSYDFYLFLGKRVSIWRCSPDCFLKCLIDYVGEPVDWDKELFTVEEHPLFCK